MSDVTETKEKVVEKVVENTAPTPAAPQANGNANANGDRPANTKGYGEAKPQRVFRKNRRKGNKRRERQRSEFDQKILDIRRVTRVSAGGRRFSFAVSIAIGDRKGRVGVGTGKAGDTALAIEKSTRNAKKNMMTVKLTDNNSIPHEVKAKYNSARVMLMPAKGRGIIAGSAVRDIIDLAGMHDINAKIISGTKNKLNIARATIKALQSLKDPKNPKKVFDNKPRGDVKK